MTLEIFDFLKDPQMALVLQNISLVIAIFGLLVFFYGKLILRVRPFKEDNSQVYPTGFLFLLLFLIFPVVILFTWGEISLFSKDGCYLVVQLAIALILSAVITMGQIKRRTASRFSLIYFFGFLMMLLMYWSFFRLVSSGTRLVLIFFSAFFCLGILALLAILYGEQKISVNIKTKKKTVTGLLIKIDDDFITLSEKDVLLHINKSEVKSIEELN